MPGRAEPPASVDFFASQHVIEMSEAAEHVEGQLVGQMSEAVLPPASSQARGLRLDWAAKRGLDITVASTALFLLLPLLLLIALIV